MIWIWSLTVLSGLLVLAYRYRYSEREIRDFPLLQFLYLFIGAPLVSACLVMIAVDIMSRTPIMTIPISDMVLFPMIICDVIVGAIGIGIHSTNVSLSGLIHDHRSEAYQFNNKIHGILSHHMSYISTIFLLLLFIILEFNHPIVDHFPNFILLIFLGITFGILVTVSIVRSTYILGSLFSALIVVLVTSILFFVWSIDPAGHPVTVVAYGTLVTLSILLAASKLLQNTSPSLWQKYVGFIFPKQPYEDDD
jgi:hypothetical protein